MPHHLTSGQVLSRLERFCAFQERCHAEVRRKLLSLGTHGTDAEDIIVKLIETGFLNETRFAQAFARGRHRIKRWGLGRIESELKARGISAANIRIALKEIEDDEYDKTFEELAVAVWTRLKETHPLKKRKKFCNALLRKGYDADLVYAKAKKLEAGTKN